MNNIYVMKSELGLVKIGISSSPRARARNVSASSGIKTILVESFSSKRAKEVEYLAHKKLTKKRAVGEWFRCTERQAISIVKKSFKELGISIEGKSRKDEMMTYTFRPGIGLMERVDALRACENNKPSRAEMLRLLIERAPLPGQPKPEPKARKRTQGLDKLLDVVKRGDV